MRSCCLCKKKLQRENGAFFGVPKDEHRRKVWSEICRMQFSANSRVCEDHFLTSDIIKGSKKAFLLPKAVPTLQIKQTQNRLNITVNGTKNTENIFSDNQKEGVFTQHFLNLDNVMKDQPISCKVSTQTNARFCGLVETSGFADEFRLNCFYCPETFPLGKWKRFVNHLNKNHFEREEAFKISKYVSEDHDYTPISLPPPSTPAECDFETVDVDEKSRLPFLADPLESTTYNPLQSVILNTESPSTAIPIPDITNKLNDSDSEAEPTKTKSTKNINKKQLSKKTALSRCLKRANVKIIQPEENQEYETFSFEYVQQNPTEMVFEYTPRDMIDLLLDNMKNYPVLWQFDGERFNEDFYEAVQDLCKIINEKWSLNIDNLKMRRSINRILRFYCYLYPNENVENINQFTHYYDKCAAFLPSSVNEIAYARCSHCYICYRNDFDLKRHLLEEQKYLQWPYKCVQCKECFRESDEYEFHKSLSHYGEIFRCEPCNKTFFRRNIYNRHIVEYHPKDSDKPGKYLCNICGKAFKTSGNLHGHKIYHGERKYKCHLCPKSYFVNCRLALHLKSHRKEYNLMCEVCGKGFREQANLREHMKKHTGAKVTCNICNLKLRESSLMRHLRTVHVAYEGTVETTFRAKNHHYKKLLRPMASHAYKRKCKEIIYHCKVCEISFENYKLVVEHNKQFHSDVQWPCKLCNTKFRQKLTLKRHYRKKHNLHVFQIFKLVNQNEDLNEVLAIKTDQLDQLAETFFDHPMCDTKNETTSTNSSKTTTIKSDSLSGEIYIEEEQIHSSIIQDEIMQTAENIVTPVIKIDMNEFFIDP